MLSFRLSKIPKSLKSTSLIIALWAITVGIVTLLLVFL